MSKIKIALLGFGNVGQAFARYTERPEARDPLELCAIADSSGGVLLENRESVRRLLTHKQAGRSIRQFAPGSIIQDMREYVRALEGAGVSAMVETLPTNLTDGQPALDLIREALLRGINVVTVNKGPLVHGLSELEEAARSTGTRLAYAGATGVRVPEEFAGLHILEIRGVLNGTTNFILTEMQERSLTFEAALAKAQVLGIAEPDPALDIEGWDTASKILILARAHMRADARLSDVSRIGIGPETEALIQTARGTGRRVRLIGRARMWQERVRVSVAPKILGEDSPFFSVAGTAKAALFTTEEKGEILVAGQSSLESIARTIFEDLVRFTG